MRFPLSTPEELSSEPELAPLVILGATAEVSRRALLAAHPELAEGDIIAEDPEVTARQCLAAAILTALQGLDEALARYGAHLDSLAARRPIQPVDKDDFPF